MRLVPGKDEDHREDKQQYIGRITSEFPNIPADVLDQWIYPHHFNEEIRLLYGWMDYEKVVFTLAEWGDDQIASIKVYSDFRPYVEMTTRKVRSALPDKLRSIELREEVVRSWAERGTWRTPIIVLDSKDVAGAPKGVEINRPYQLVEGHTRLGWFNAFRSVQGRDSKNTFTKTHRLWLMSVPGRS
jgi:hypothetical protein